MKTLQHRDVWVGRNVLVLGHGTRAFLSVIRSLGRLGLRVHVAMCGSDDLALRSKYVVARHEVSSDHWLDDMVALLQRVEFSLVLPCGDESMHPVQLHQGELRKWAPVYAYPDALYRVAFSKYESSSLASRLGIPVPRQVDLSPETDVDALLVELSLPLVLKPPSSISGRDSRERLEVMRVRSEAELEARLKEFVALGDGAVAQENFIGIGVGVEVLAKDGEVIVAFQHQRVHEPVEGGGSSYRRSTPLYPELHEATLKLMEALNYTGVAMVEFKLNPRNGEWVFIEINGRFWGSLPLAVAAGADFPRYLFEMLHDADISYSGAYREEIYCRSLLDDYYWFASNLRADHSDPTQATVPVKQVLSELRHVVRGIERIDTWAAGDMAPAWGELALILRRMARKSAESVLKLLTPAIVYERRASRIRNAFERANTVGFVCYGNICRSPFAERYAASKIGDKKFWSSGFHDVTDRASPGIGIAVSTEFGVDLSEARSSCLSGSLLNTADLILVFDEKNARMVEERFPSAVDRTFFLGDALADFEREIEDPYGGTARDFSKAYKRISSAIDALISLDAK